MSYSFNLITLPSECDSLTRTSQREKRNIEARQKSMAVRTENSAEDVQENAAEVISLTASIAASNTIIASLPDGPGKEKEITKKMDFEVRLRKLNEIGTRLNPVSQLEREYDMDLLDAQMEHIDAFIAAVAAHKATLS